MNSDDTIILYIILRESLHLDHDQTAYCAADAVQHILLKYFLMQLLAQKTHLDALINNTHVKTTTQWLASKSKKTIISVDDDVWNKLKQDFSKDLFCLKDKAQEDIETTLVFWPVQDGNIPYLKNL